MVLKYLVVVKALGLRFLWVSNWPNRHFVTLFVRAGQIICSYYSGPTNWLQWLPLTHSRFNITYLVTRISRPAWVHALGYRLESNLTKLLIRYSQEKLKNCHRRGWAKLIIPTTQFRLNTTPLQLQRIDYRGFLASVRLNVTRCVNML